MLAAPRSITTVNNAGLGPISGYLVDRFGPRIMATCGIFVMGLGLVMFGLTHYLWMYFLSNVIIAAGTTFQGMLVLSVAINQWFRRKRTMAQSVMMLGFPMAGLVGIPLLGLVQASLGWQTAAIGSGILIWAVGLPCAQLLRTRPETYGLLPDGDSPQAIPTGRNRDGNGEPEFDFTLRQALRTRAFWLLASAGAIGNVGMGAVQTHLFLHLERGAAHLSPATATLVWSVASFTNMPCRLLAGFLGDRLPKQVMLGVSMLLMSTSVFILAIATSAEMAFAFALIYGVGWGIRTPIINAIQADYFGRKSLGKIVGWLQAPAIPTTVAAPILVGYLADLQGNYRMAFMITSLVSLVGGVLLFLATAPKRPAAERSDT